MFVPGAHESAAVEVTTSSGTKRISLHSAENAGSHACDGVPSVVLLEFSCGAHSNESSVNMQLEALELEMTFEHIWDKACSQVLYEVSFCVPFNSNKQAFPDFIGHPDGTFDQSEEASRDWRLRCALQQTQRILLYVR